MKQFVVGAAVVAFAAGAAMPPVAAAQGSTQAAAPAAGTSLGSVTLRQQVMADGKPLAAGTYQVRLTADEAKPAVGQSPSAERYVEFLRGGKVVGRELATIVSAGDLKEIAEGPRPGPGGSRVELLKGNDYVRVWINRGGTNYIIHLPPAKG
jgi:hypothetical protein